MKVLEGKYYIADLTIPIGVRIIEISEIAKIMYVEYIEYTVDYLKVDLIAYHISNAVKPLIEIGRIYPSQKLMEKELLEMVMRTYRYKVEEIKRQKDIEEREKKEEKNRKSWWPFG